MALPKTHLIKPGDTFGRWTVIGPRTLIARGGDRWNRSAYPCRCSCAAATERVIAAEYLLSGNSRSCGCLAREMIAGLRLSHGRSGERLWFTWRNMLRRCQNPKCASYPRYGGRGITVCPEWQDYETFRAWALANGYADDLTIERKDNDQGYSPGNCQWATTEQQNRNTRHNRLLTAYGETKSLVEWSEDARCPVTLRGLVKRLRIGWSDEDALTKPARVTRTKPAGVAITDDAAALSWAKENAPAAVVERLDKKALGDVLKASGEVLPFAQFTEAEEVFYIR